MVSKHFSRYEILHSALSYAEISFYFPIIDITLASGSISSWATERMIKFNQLQFKIQSFGGQFRILLRMMSPSPSLHPEVTFILASGKNRVSRLLCSFTGYDAVSLSLDTVPWHQLLRPIFCPSHASERAHSSISEQILPRRPWEQFGFSTALLIRT